MTFTAIPNNFPFLKEHFDKINNFYSMSDAELASINLDGFVFRIANVDYEDSEWCSDPVLEDNIDIDGSEIVELEGELLTLEPEKVLEHILAYIETRKPLEGKKIEVSLVEMVEKDGELTKDAVEGCVYNYFPQSEEINRTAALEFIIRAKQYMIEHDAMLYQKILLEKGQERYSSENNEETQNWEEAYLNRLEAIGLDEDDVPAVYDTISNTHPFIKTWEEQQDPGDNELDFTEFPVLYEIRVIGAKQPDAEDQLHMDEQYNELSDKLSWPIVGNIEEGGKFVETWILTPEFFDFNVQEGHEGHERVLIVFNNRYGSQDVTVELVGITEKDGKIVKAEPSFRDDLSQLNVEENLTLKPFVDNARYCLAEQMYYIAEHNIKANKGKDFYEAAGNVVVMDYKDSLQNLGIKPGFIPVLKV